MGQSAGTLVSLPWRTFLILNSQTVSTYLCVRLHCTDTFVTAIHHTTTIVVAIDLGNAPLWLKFHARLSDNQAPRSANILAAVDSEYFGDDRSFCLRSETFSAKVEKSLEGFRRMGKRLGGNCARGSAREWKSHDIHVMHNTGTFMRVNRLHRASVCVDVCVYLCTGIYFGRTRNARKTQGLISHPRYSRFSSTWLEEDYARYARRSNVRRSPFRLFGGSTRGSSPTIRKIWKHALEMDVKQVARNSRERNTVIALIASHS